MEEYVQLTYRSSACGAESGGAIIFVVLAGYWSTRTVTGFPVAKGRLLFPIRKFNTTTTDSCGNTIGGVFCEYDIEVRLDTQFLPDPTLTHPSSPVYYTPTNGDIIGLSLFSYVTDAILTHSN